MKYIPHMLLLSLSCVVHAMNIEKIKAAYTKPVSALAQAFNDTLTSMAQREQQLLASNMPPSDEHLQGLQRVTMGTVTNLAAQLNIGVKALRTSRDRDAIVPILDALQSMDNAVARAQITENMPVTGQALAYTKIIARYREQLAALHTELNAQLP